MLLQFLKNLPILARSRNDGKTVGETETGDYRDEVSDLAASCTQCGLCTRHCSFLQKFGNPGALAQRALQEGVAVEMPFSCSLCQLCTAVCPENLDPSKVFWRMRCELVGKEHVDFSRYRASLFYEAAGTSRLLSWAHIPEGCRTVFFPGCALPGSRPRQYQYLVELLQKEISRLGVVMNCCGKPSHDLGRVEESDKIFKNVARLLSARGVQTVLTSCPSCHQMFKRYGGAIETKTVYEVLADSLSNKAANHRRTVLRVHDPCASRFESSIHDSVRVLLEKMGIEAEESSNSRERTLCCGEGGSVSCVDGKLAGAWTKRAAGSGDDQEMVTYCAGCAGILGGKEPVSHILDLLYEDGSSARSKRRVSKAPFTYLNRFLLRLKVLFSRDI